MWQELNNTITNDEMLISATCKRLNGEVEEESCEGVDETPIKENIIKKNISIELGITHEYNVTITFKETNAAQNYNQGKTFGGILGVDEYKPTQFEQDSWSTIISNVKAGNIAKYNVGDTKTIDMESYGTHTLRISNTSTPSECSTEGFSQTACGFVLEFADIIALNEFNSSRTNKGGWPASDMYRFINNDVYNAMPNILKNEIIETMVISSRGSSDTSNFTSNDKLYLLAPKEIFSDWNNDWDESIDTTRQLDYYKKLNVSTINHSESIKKYSGSNNTWWLRNAYSFMYQDFFFFAIGDDGRSYEGLTSLETQGVSPAFRIG